MNQETQQQSVELPRDLYKFRVKEGNNSVSRQGNPMMILTCETIDNEPLLDKNDNPVDINGVTATTFIPLMETTYWRVNELRKAIVGTSLPEITAGEVHSEEGEAYKGLEFYAIAETETREQKNAQGKVIINPFTGKPVADKVHNIVRIIGRDN